MLRVALLGCGRIGQVHAGSVAEHRGAVLTWACDPNHAAAQAVADRFGGKPSDSVDEVFADRSVDAVIIAASTPAHLDLLDRSVRAGKPVLCEKPIDLDLGRIDAFQARAAAHDPWVMVGFNRRFDPSFREIRQRVASREIGALRQLRLTSRDPQPPPPQYVAASGGIFRDMTIHDFDMARFFIGDVVEVQAVVSAAGADQLAAAGDAGQAMVVLRGAEGTLCHITNSRSCAFGYDQRLEAFGDSGMLEALNHLPSSVRAYDQGGTGRGAPYLPFFLERYRDAYRAEFAEFVDSIGAGRPPSPDFADGRAALELAEAAIRSAASGSSVTLPLSAASSGHS